MEKLIIKNIFGVFIPIPLMLSNYIAVFLVVLFAGANAETGGTQLIQALNAGIVRMAYSGEWWTHTHSYAEASGIVPSDEFYYFIENFYPDPAYYPFPANPIGKLARIIADKKMTVANIAPGVPIRILLPGEVGNPRDIFLQTIVASMAEYYNISEGITLEYRSDSPPSNDYNLFRTSNRTGSPHYDILDCIASIGGLYKDPITKIQSPRERTYLYTFPVLANVFQGYVQKHSIWYTAEQMKMEMLAGANVTVCVGANNNNIAATTFVGPSVTFVKLGGDVELDCMTKLLAGEVDVFFSEFPTKRQNWLSLTRIVRFNKLGPTAYWTSDD
jgi:hypothetical protein